MKLLQYILIFLVRLYRWTLSPAKTLLFGPFARCRFTPSCSAYALEALQKHGALAGGRLALKRLCRCHPWGDCGHDPVPERSCRGQGVSGVSGEGGLVKPDGSDARTLAPCAAGADAGDRS